MRLEKYQIDGHWLLLWKTYLLLKNLVTDKNEEFVFLQYTVSLMVKTNYHWQKAENNFLLSMEQIIHRKK